MAANKTLRNVFLFGSFFFLAFTIWSMFHETNHLDKVFLEQRVWWLGISIGLIISFLLFKILTRFRVHDDLKSVVAFLLCIFIIFNFPVLISYINRTEESATLASCRKYIVLAGQKSWRSGSGNDKNTTYEVTLDVDGSELAFRVDSGVYFQLAVGDSIEMCSATGQLGLKYAVSFKHEWLHLNLNPR